jgi:acyl carrier protein
MKSLDAFIGNFENTVEGVESGSLNEQTAFRSLKQWDSLAVLMFIDMVDLEYNVHLNSKQMQEAETLGDLHRLIVSEGVGE